jgi:hypothetical protein
MRVEGTSELVSYMLPELFILIFILGNNIHERLIGLEKKSETEYEPVIKAIYRNVS